MRHPHRPGPALQAGDLEQLQPMQDQNAMLDACEAGDVQKLQRLFKVAGVKQGDKAFDPFFGEPVSAFGPPPTSTMVAAAVAQQQPAIIQFLFNTYRSIKIDRDSIIEAVLSDPHLPTLEALHAHTPEIVDYEFQETHTTFLMEACRSSDPFLPTCLLNLGADPNECDLTGTGPLLYAVKYLQPYEVIVTMVEYGAVVTGHVIQTAVQRQASDILRYLLDRGNLDRPKQMLQQAEDTGNKTIITMVWERTKKGEKAPLKRQKKKGSRKFIYEERIARAKWWQFEK